MLKQIVETVSLNLKSIPQRIGLSLVIVVGIAGVVGVFTALFAMSRGIEATFAASGDPRNVIVMRGGSQAELNSTLNLETMQIVERTAGVARDEKGEPLASGEVIVITELPRKGETLGANVTMRGITADGFVLRPNLKIVEGRAFTPGLQELLVGRGAANQFEGLKVGTTVRLRGGDWNVVGVFESNDSFESEIFADAATAQTAWGRPNTFSTVLTRLDSPDGIKAFQAALKTDPRVNVEAKNQVAYYTEQTQQTTQGIRMLGTAVAFIMGLGAIFAALNTMYAAVSARTREIATLRAIGFGGFPVVVSVLIEAMLLALLGGLAGALIAYVLFNGMTVSTLGSGFTQLVFAFKVSPGLVMQGTIIALVVGLLGGLLPALQSSFSSLKSWVWFAKIVEFLLSIEIVAATLHADGPIAVYLFAVLAAAVLNGVLCYFVLRYLLLRRSRREFGSIWKLLLTVLTLVPGLLLLGPILAIYALRAIWTSAPENLLRNPGVEGLRAA